MRCMVRGVHLCKHANAELVFSHASFYAGVRAKAFEVGEGAFWFGKPV